MKITILQGAFLPVPALRGGAVEKVWMSLAQEFTRQGHEVLHVSRLCDSLPESEVIQGVAQRRVRGFDTPRNLVKLKICDLLFTLRARRVIPKSDIVVTNTFWAPLLLSPQKHGPLWVHVQRYPKGQMALYRRALKLQTVSRVIADAIIEQAPKLREKVCIIPNPLPPFEATNPAPHRKLKQVLFVGRIHPEKGLDLLVEAAKLALEKDPDLNFRVIGPWEEKFGGGGSQYINKLQESARPIAGKLAFEGAIFDQSKLHSCYLESGLFVYPSLAAKGEASPVAPLEALAGACPVLTSQLQCFEDLLGNGPFAHRFNHEAGDAARQFADAILRVTSDPGQWVHQSTAARARATEFRPELIGREYLRQMTAALGLP